MRGHARFLAGAACLAEAFFCGSLGGGFLRRVLFRRLLAHGDLFAPRPPDLGVVPGSQDLVDKGLVALALGTEPVEHVTVEAEGEILELKNTINGMVDNLSKIIGDINSVMALVGEGTLTRLIEVEASGEFEAVFCCHDVGDNPPCLTGC